MVQGGDIGGMENKMNIAQVNKEHEETTWCGGKARIYQFDTNSYQPHGLRFHLIFSYTLGLEFSTLNPGANIMPAVLKLGFSVLTYCELWGYNGKFQAL